MKVFKVVPRFEDYSVSENGELVTSDTAQPVIVRMWGDRWVASVKVGDKWTILPVHRAVALAWVENTRPGVATIVNHKDGNPLNNHYSNLEWVTYAENNVHAVETGLRNDNIPCKVRNYYTKEVIHFASTAQAKRYMGMRPNDSNSSLIPSMFGRLILGKYEVRYDTDNTPWFYENMEKIRPARHRVTVSDGKSEKVYYSHRKLLMGYQQLYRSPSKSMSGLSAYGNTVYPNLTFKYEKCTGVNDYENTRMHLGNKAVGVYATKGNETLNFSSMTKAASHFGVDRSSIKYRLKNSDELLDGWKLHVRPPLSSDTQIKTPLIAGTPLRACTTTASSNAKPRFENCQDEAISSEAS